MGIFDSKKVSTQSHLDIEDIRDNVVVLKSGKVSAVIETTSLNFDLLAEREQDSRIYTFAGLLNSLRFPIQIVIRTQETDTSKYLDLIEDFKNKSGSNALRQQIEIYQSFIGNLTDRTEILNKKFYVVVPTTTSAPVVKTNPIKQLFGREEQIINSDDLVQKALVELQPKRDHILKQLSNMGLYAHQLKNDELIKLYYSIYEPDKMGLEVMNVNRNPIEAAMVNTNPN